MFCTSYTNDDTTLFLKTLWAALTAARTLAAAGREGAGGAPRKEENRMDDFIFVEIFSIKLPGGNGPVSMQRRFEIKESWHGHLDELPIVPDRSHYGTLFVPAEVAVLLLRGGVLREPGGASYCVQYAGRGVYFSTNRDALAYCARRWPAAIQMFNDDLHKGAPLEISQCRRDAFDADADKLRPWFDKADALSAQIRANNSTAATV